MLFRSRLELAWVASPHLNRALRLHAGQCSFHAECPATLKLHRSIVREVFHFDLKAEESDIVASLATL